MPERLSGSRCDARLVGVGSGGRDARSGCGFAGARANGCRLTAGAKGCSLGAGTNSLRLDGAERRLDAVSVENAVSVISLVVSMLTLPPSFADHLRDLLSEAHHLQERFARQALDRVVPDREGLEKLHLREDSLPDFRRRLGIFLQRHGAVA